MSTSAPTSPAAAGAGGGATRTPLGEAATKLSSVSEAARLAWLDGVDTVLLDCDGVIWLETTPIEGAAAAIESLKKAGKRVVFVSNNSTKSRDMYVEKLAGFGITAVKEDIITSAYCAVSYLKKIGYEGKVYMFGEKGLSLELAAAGFEHSGLEDAAHEFDPKTFGLHLLDPEVRAVIAGSDRAINYYKIAMASSYVRYNDAHFVVTNKDATFPSAEMTLPGGGALISAIEVGCGKEPEIVAGKPSAHMMDQIIFELGIDVSRTVMVGDRLDTDIQFGNRGGTQSLLVLTGVSSEEQVAGLQAGDDRLPSVICSSIVELGDVARAAVAARK